MDPEDTDSLYFDWLHSQVEAIRVRPSARTHRSLLRQFHDTIFVAIVAHDENRIADAKDLRYKFLAENPGVQGSLEWMETPCTMLELLIVLSISLAFEMDDDVKIWFWHLVSALDLAQFSDRAYNEQAQETVQEALDSVIWRTYLANGQGGLFPLRNPDRDQRDVELWYQLNAYLLEQF